MKKTFKLDEIDCANCALKLEEALRRVDGVQEVKVNFLSQKLTLTASDAICTGIRIVLAWSAMALVIAWRIHHVA